MLFPPSPVVRLSRCVRPVVSRLAWCLGSLLAVTAAAQTAATGTIEGRVANAANGSYLNNAQVTVAGTTRETFTNRFGNFRLTDLPAGEAQIRIFYTGLTPETRVVTVIAG